MCLLLSGDICAAKFEDDQWYRAKVEKVTNKEVQVFYIDYGNKESTTPARCASLPSSFTAEKPFAHEFALAFVKLPIDVSVGVLSLSLLNDTEREINKIILLHCRLNIKRKPLKHSKKILKEERCC